MRTFLLIVILVANNIVINSKEIKIEMEVYYLVFENTMTNIKSFRAFVKVPQKNNIYEYGKQVTVAISRKENTLHMDCHIEDSSAYYMLDGKIVGNNDEYTYVCFNFFPLICSQQKYREIKYEQGITKIIYMNFIEADNSAGLKYNGFRLYKKEYREPIVFK